MRLPDIPIRHRRLVRATVTVSYTALSLVRRRDHAPQNRAAVGIAYSLATAATAWMIGTKAYAMQTEIDGIDTVFDRKFGSPEVGESGGSPEVREQSNPAAEKVRAVVTGDPDSWWDEDASRHSQSFVNAAAALAAGGLTWATWVPLQKLADWWEAKLPGESGRITGAVLNGATMYGVALLLDRTEQWKAEQDAADERATDADGRE